MHLSETRQLLAQLTLTKELPPAMRLRAIMLLLGHGHEVTATEGQILFEQGGADDDVAFILLHGEVLISKDEMPPLTVQAPELLGELVKYSPIPLRSATVRAVGETKLLKFLWSPYLETAAQMFTPQEQEQLRRTIGNIAWSHFAT